MKYLLLVFFLAALPARSQSLQDGLEAFYDQLNAYQIPRYAPDTTRPRLLLPGDFNSQQLQNLHLNDREVVRVDLVYSAFRLNPTFNQRQLNLGRLRALLAQLPALATHPALTWNLVEQTGCTSPAECQEYFHGFVLYTATRRTKADAQAEADTLRRRLARLPAPPKTAAKTAHPLTKSPPHRITKTAVRCAYPVSRFSLDELTKRLKHAYDCRSKVAQTLAFRAEADAKGRVLRVEILNPPPGGCGPVLAAALARSFSFETGFRIGNRLFPMSVTGVVHLPLHRHSLAVTGFLVADSLQRRYRVRHLRDGCTAGFAPPDTLGTPAPETSAVSQVFARHPDWSQRLVVADVTGSMLPYTLDLLTWLQLTATQGERTFVFFNDGDDAPDNKKPLGQTGGLHEITTTDFAQVKNKVFEAMLAGGGGDQPENDAEALLRAHALVPTAHEIILLADNQTFPRDTKLLRDTRLPVRIILCGATPVINPKYLALARERGYTLHTLAGDITNLSTLLEGQVTTIQGVKYEVTKGGFKQVSAP